MCSWQGDTLCFTVDFALGFTCFDSKTKVRVKEKENIILYFLQLLKLSSIAFYLCLWPVFIPPIYSTIYLFSPTEM